MLTREILAHLSIVTVGKVHQFWRISNVHISRFWKKKNTMIFRVEFTKRCAQKISFSHCVYLFIFRCWIFQMNKLRNEIVCQVKKNHVLFFLWPHFGSKIEFEILHSTWTTKSYGLFFRRQWWIHHAVFSNNCHELQVRKMCQKGNEKQLMSPPSRPATALASLRNFT